MRRALQPAAAAGKHASGRAACAPDRSLQGSPLWGSRRHGRSRQADVPLSSAATAWQRQGPPSKAEIGWDANFGGHHVGGHLKGVPASAAAGRSLEEQREYLQDKTLMSTTGPEQPRRARMLDWRSHMKEQSAEEARARAAKDAPAYSDNVTRRITNRERGRRTRLDQELLESFPDVEVSSPAVQAAFAQLEGIDPVQDVKAVHTEAPDCLYITHASGGPRSQIRQRLKREDYTASRAWFEGGGGTPCPAHVVVVLSESGSYSFAEWARRAPEIQFIVVSDLVAGLFRCLSRHGGEDLPPDNMKHVRTRADFWFQADACIPDGSIDEILIPYPRAMASVDSAHKRSPHRALLALFHQKLKVGGRVRTTTSSEGMDDWITLQFEKCDAKYTREKVADLHFSPLLVKHVVNTEEVGDRPAPTVQDGSLRPPSAAPRVQQWVKTEMTPEVVYDLNDSFNFARINHHALKL